MMKRITPILMLLSICLFSCSLDEENKRVEKLNEEMSESFARMYTDIEEKSKMRTNSGSHFNTKTPDNVEQSELPE